MVKQKGRALGRFHRHEDGTEHSHDHTHDHDHPHEHEHGDHSGYATGGERIRSSRPSSPKMTAVRR